MSLPSRRELLSSLAPRYKCAGKSEKARILDELVATCGYNRKYAITVLHKPPPSKPAKRRVRSRKYGPDVGAALCRLWKLSRGLCPKRLIPFLPELIAALENHDELCYPPDLRRKLLAMSISTAERLLARERRVLDQGISTTRPGELLRQQIPFHTFGEWKEVDPGYLEIDLVAHCGESAAGQFLYTLTATDIASGWTEMIALTNRGQLAVQAAIERLRLLLPFPLLGIDCDNGGEFINFSVKQYCDLHRIQFTRGRPCLKNDQCYVEQKNGDLVRQVAGYARYEGQDAVRQLNRLYDAYRLHVNFFRPSMKLIAKSRNGAKVSKKYDRPQTPFRRLLGSGIWSEEEEAFITRTYTALNPAELVRGVDEFEAGLRRHAVHSNEISLPPKRAHGRLPGNLFGKILK